MTNMNVCAVLGFALWSLLFLCNGTDINNRLVYNWEANLTSGSLLPTEHVSRYEISGSVVIIYVEQSLLFQLENVFTNEMDFNASVLSLPFALNYTDNDNLVFKIHPDDELWSINMKRSIGSLFQLKTDALHEGAFVLPEDNIYGKCDTEHIVSNIDGGIKVLKLINELSCSDSPIKSRSNTPFFNCPSAFQEGVASNNERVYTLLKIHQPFISHVLSVGTIHYQPFQALAEAYHIYVSQTLQLIEISNDTNSALKFLVPTSLTTINITYVPEFDHNPTSGRVPANRSLINEEIYKLFEKLSESLNWELSTKDLDNQTSFHILELMWRLNLDDWENLYQIVMLGTSYIQETIQHFFWDLIPQVGSENAALFIKRLVTSKRIKGFLASSLLATFPLHMRHTSEQFLKDSEDLLHLTEVDPDIRYAAMLGFASLVHRTCNSHCSDELVDRYTKFYLDRFIDNQDYQERMVYLQALSNMQLTRILDFLSPIITNPSYSQHIRSLAIGSTISIIHKHPNEVVEIFWPIFMNRSESLEIRGAAFSVLLITNPTVNRLLTFFWYMKSEPNYHLYNLFFTTVRSFANTKYPCYSRIRETASQLSRYMVLRAHRWATGNYLLDYEDVNRGYGGLLHTLIIASEKTGLPNSIYFTTEQHSHGLSSKFSIYFKIQGLLETLRIEIFDNETIFKNSNIQDVFKKLNFSTKLPEEVHFEVVVKADGNTIYCKYLNQSSLKDIVIATKQATALYYEFSINYQRLQFPLRYEIVRLTDLGTPVTLQIRTASLLSLRGSIKQYEKQYEKGQNRDAELDFRYSMDTVTSMKTYNPLSKEWYGADRTRSLHMRLPFSIHLFQRLPSVFQLTTNRHKDFVDGSLLGMVWHSRIKLFPTRPEEVFQNKNHHHSPYSWSIKSRDLGAELAAEVFDCQSENDISNSLLIVKEAFLTSNKNHKIVTGGGVILGLYSLANYFTFLPPGDSCGIIVSIAPSGVQLELLKEGDMIKLSLLTEQKKNVIWDLTTWYIEKENEGKTDIKFKLEHSETEQNLTASSNAWRILEFGGHVKIPSYITGVLKAPGPAEGQANISWGNSDRQTKIELQMYSDNTAENWPSNCEDDTATCLQIASNLATHQTVGLKCTNLTIWLTAALLSIFPDNIQASEKSTNIKFNIPAKLPWTIQGICVLNTKKVLNFDNGTILAYDQRPNCYSIAVSDCSPKAQFIVGLRKSEISNFVELKIIYMNSQILEIIPATGINITSSVYLNGTRITILNEYRKFPSYNGYVFKTKYWETAKMVEVTVAQTGLTLQYYGHSVVAVASGILRGKLCGLCGDFNGETSNDNISLPSCIYM